MSLLYPSKVYGYPYPAMELKAYGINKTVEKFKKPYASKMFVNLAWALGWLSHDEAETWRHKANESWSNYKKAHNI